MLSTSQQVPYQRLLALSFLLLVLCVDVHGFVFKPAEFGRSRTRTNLWSTKAPKVLYQKTVRPAPHQPPILFLSQLVEYLQHRFELPVNLPINFEKDTSSLSIKNTNTVVQWDSPITANPLTVEIVGIHTEEQTTIPDMAMVVVKQSDEEWNGIKSPVVLDLTRASEKKIFRALDRGLDDFTNGKIKFANLEPDKLEEQGQKTKVNYQSFEKAFQAEMEATSPEDITIEATPIAAENMSLRDAQPRQDAKDVVIDAVSVAEEEHLPSKDTDIAQKPPKTEPDFAVTAAKAAKTKKRNKTNEVTGEYALEAAKKLAVKQRKSGEFAVEAAKTAASKKERVRGQVRRKKDAAWGASLKPVFTKRQVEIDAPKSTETLKHTMGIPSISGPQMTISTPESRRKKKKKSENAKIRKQEKQGAVLPKQNRENLNVKGGSATVTQKQSQNVEQKQSERVETTARATKETIHPKQKQQNSSVESAGFSVTEKQSEDVEQKSEKSEEGKQKRNLNIKTVDDMNSVEDLSKSAEAINDPELKRSKEAEEIMSQIAAAGEDMTAEDLLKDVLKFGEEKDKEEAVGSGFVSGAFEKAKQLEFKRQHRRKISS